MQKLGAIHWILYVCALVFPLLAVKWPQWWLVAVGGLTVAHLVAINTHKPGAADLLGKALGIAAEAQKKIPPLPVLFVVALLALIGCGPNEPAKWPATTKAIAGATLDYAECLQTNLTALAQQGATAFSKDAVIAQAEVCGIASVPDGFAILVAAFKDLSARFHNQQAAAPSPATPQGP